MNIEACIFDLDGVIVDTAKYHFMAWKRLADELNIDFTKQDNERLKGVSRLHSLDILLELGGLKLGGLKFGEEVKHILAEKKNEWYLELINEMDESQVLPGTKQLLEELKSNNIKIALGSASKNAKTILEKVELLGHFDVIIDGNHVENAKPDPEVFILGATSLGVDPCKCIVFEDAKAGVEAGKRAKMKVVGIGDEGQLAEADYNFNGLYEIDYNIIRNI